MNDAQRYRMNAAECLSAAERCELPCISAIALRKEFVSFLVRGNGPALAGGRQKGCGIKLPRARFYPRAFFIFRGGGAYRAAVFVDWCPCLATARPAIAADTQRQRSGGLGLLGGTHRPASTGRRWIGLEPSLAATCGAQTFDELPLVCAVCAIAS
jgi:hypothetical protein